LLITPETEIATEYIIGNEQIRSAVAYTVPPGFHLVPDRILDIGTEQSRVNEFALQEVERFIVFEVPFIAIIMFNKELIAAWGTANHAKTG
jgi:hypothetical protein